MNQIFSKIKQIYNRLQLIVKKMQNHKYYKAYNSSKTINFRYFCMYKHLLQIQK